MTEDKPSNLLPEVSSIVEAEALAWVAQLNGDDITEQDLSAFQEWVQRSPAHQKEITELAEFWEDLNILTTMDETIRQTDMLSKNLRNERAYRKWQYRLLIPSALACAFLAFLFFPVLQPFFGPNSPSTSDSHVTMPLVFKSDISKRQKHVLADGTVITLNTNSFVEVDYTSQQRNVRLVKGEALFNVAHDTHRPFVVFANDGIVRALGTEFSIRLLADKIDIIVSEGSVELATFSSAAAPGSSPTAMANSVQMASLGIVTVGQSAEVKDNKASIKLISQEEMDAELSWKDGLLIFRGESLSEVIAEVNRYTLTQITVDDPALQSLRIGGVFNSGETDLLFKTLESQFDIVAEPIDDNAVRLVRKE